MIAYIDHNADKKITDALRKRGFEVILLAPFEALAHPVSSHADTLLFALGDTVLFHRDYTFEARGFDRIVRIDKPMGKTYPHDIPLNIAVVGCHAFCNVKNAASEALSCLNERGYTIHNVKQGYAHCSVCKVGDSALITADAGIARAAREAGLDVLLISSGSIELPPYSEGFIGGASGSTNKGVYFCGSLSFHPNGKEIKAFIESHGKEIVELTDAPLFDVGGILFV